MKSPNPSASAISFNLFNANVKQFKRELKSALEARLNIRFLLLDVNPDNGQGICKVESADNEANIKPILHLCARRAYNAICRQQNAGLIVQEIDLCWLKPLHDRKHHPIQYAYGESSERHQFINPELSSAKASDTESYKGHLPNGSGVCVHSASNEYARYGVVMYYAPLKGSWECKKGERILAAAREYGKSLTLGLAALGASPL